MKLLEAWPVEDTITGRAWLQLPLAPPQMLLMWNQQRKLPAIPHSFPIQVNWLVNYYYYIHACATNYQILLNNN